MVQQKELTKAEHMQMLRQALAKQLNNCGMLSEDTITFYILDGEIGYCMNTLSPKGSKLLTMIARISKKEKEQELRKICKRLNRLAK